MTDTLVTYTFNCESGWLKNQLLLRKSVLKSAQDKHLSILKTYLVLGIFSFLQSI